MRPDFNKLLYERERLKNGRDRGKQGINNDNHREFSKGKAAILNDVPEDFVTDDLWVSHPYETLPTHEQRVGRKKNNKFGNENLSPLRRYLLSEVGNHWDDIYSEICKHNHKNKTINFHIFQHLFREVEIQTRIGPKGLIQYFSNRSGWQDVDDFYKRYARDRVTEKLYIHPVTKILCSAKPKKIQLKTYNWQWFRWNGSPDKRFFFENGIWYQIVFEILKREDAFFETEITRPLKKHQVDWNYIFNRPPEIDWIKVKEKKEVEFKCLHFKSSFENTLYKGKTHGCTYENLFSFWGRPMRAIGKFQLSTQDVKKHNLVERKKNADKKYRSNPRIEE